jgi:catechol 2,3-dioxygenase-like lactoylglutathione lyase family enzyme
MATLRAGGIGAVDAPPRPSLPAPRLASAPLLGLRRAREASLMIGYVTIGTKDMARACAFYDQLLALVDARQLMGMDRIKFYGTAMNAPMLAVCTPYDGGEQRPGNGTMVAIPASREKVDALHAKAMALGATDEGAPGERLPVFYGAYVRDLDGNKLCFFEMKLG